MAANLLCFSAAAADATLHQSFLFPSSPLLTHSLLFSLLLSLSDRFTVASLLAFCCFSWKLLLKITKLLVSFSLCHRLRLRLRFCVACQVSSASFLLASFSLNSAPPLFCCCWAFLIVCLSYGTPPSHALSPCCCFALDFPARIEIETPRSAIVFICPAKWHNRSSPAPCLPLPPSSRSQLTGSFVVPRFSTRCQLQKEQTNKQNYVHKRNPHLDYYSRHAPAKGSS